MASLSVNEDIDGASKPFLPVSVSTSNFSVYSWIEDLGTFFQSALKSIADFFSSATSRTQRHIKEDGYTWMIHFMFTFGPRKLLVLIHERLDGLAATAFTAESEFNPEGRMCIASFYALDVDAKEADQILFSVLAISIAFGTIHCVGWALTFPSLAEAWIWRISSIGISITPLPILLWNLLCLWQEQVALERSKWTKEFIEGLEVLFRSFFFCMLPIYVVARILLLLEAFISLRTVSPGALEVVEWTIHLPHI